MKLVILGSRELGTTEIKAIDVTFEQHPIQKRDSDLRKRTESSTYLELEFSQLELLVQFYDNVITGDIVESIHSMVSTYYKIIGIKFSTFNKFEDMDDGSRRAFNIYNPLPKYKEATYLVMIY